MSLNQESFTQEIIPMSLNQESFTQEIIPIDVVLLFVLCDNIITL